jgi:hypothetical protein
MSEHFDLTNETPSTEVYAITSIEHALNRGHEGPTR